jgi:hypothetical protein
MSCWPPSRCCHPDRPHREPGRFHRQQRSLRRGKHCQDGHRDQLYPRRDKLALIRFINRQTRIAKLGISLSLRRLLNGNEYLAGVQICVEQASQYHGGSMTKRANNINEYTRGLTHDKANDGLQPDTDCQAVARANPVTEESTNESTLFSTVS